MNVYATLHHGSGPHGCFRSRSSAAPGLSLTRVIAVILLAAVIAVGARAGDALPFKHKVEVFRDKADDGGAMVFSVQLEQPFFAEEFEKSNFLRLQPLDERAYLVYPKETRFHQKHAAFYGRLRGEGTAKLRLSYETVTENLDGSRRIEVREGEIEIKLPAEESGPRRIYTDWANQQNKHFLDLLRYYPDDSFLQYCLLQSGARYGVTPPRLALSPTAGLTLETNMYQVANLAQALQQDYQNKLLSGKIKVGDLEHHISALTPPRLRGPDYSKLLRKKMRSEKVEPRPLTISKLIPEDQYLLYFRSLAAADELAGLVGDWGGGLLRLVAPRAQNNHVIEKYEDQLCLKRGELERLFADDAIAEFALTGADIYFIEGTDVTVVLKLKNADAFEQASRRWLDQRRAECPGLVEKDFNYHGYKVDVRYSPDRSVSSFSVRSGDYAIISNSHHAIRRMIDTLVEKTPRLFDALDYRYVSTILPPSEDADAGYFYASEAFLKQQITPQAKICEKRRVQCFNNLVMINNASLFFRLENGRSPKSLSELIEGRFIDADKLVCPHGGAYVFDAEHDTATCSMHNRLKRLTPNAELDVLKVSTQERQEYDRYKQRFAEFWGRAFNPIAVRVGVGQRVRFEACVLPFQNGKLYDTLRDSLEKKPRVIDMSHRASSAFASIGATLGRERIGEFLRGLPGIPAVLAADPTLTDLAWLGDRITLHACDDDMILEVDPTQLRPLNLFGEVSLFQQSTLMSAILAASLPTYVTIDVEDSEKAERFLELLASKIFLKKGATFGFETEFDAYRLPDYKGRANYVISYRLYAAKVRLHVALVGDRLVAATKLKPLREVIDAADAPGAAAGEPAHVLLQLSPRALDRFMDDLRLYWAERSRRACHGNIMSIYSLIKLYDTPIEELDRLSDSKYGVTYFCPDGGVYSYDAETDAVTCSIHGDRRHSRQEISAGGETSFTRLVNSLKNVSAALRYQDDALIATLDLVRREKTRADTPSAASGE